MAKRIITISREFGSGGRFIGEELAKKLGVWFISGIYSGKCGTVSEKRLVCICICRT